MDMNRKLAEHRWIYQVEAEGTRSAKVVLLSILKLLLILMVTVVTSEFLYHLGIGSPNLIMLYLLAVLIISYITPSYLYGILAALLYTIVYDYLITVPRMSFSFTIGLPITLFIMLAVTIVTSTLTIQAKAKARIATDREQRVQTMYNINEELLAARDINTIVNIARSYLDSHLRCPVMVYTSDPAAGDIGTDAPADDTPLAVFYTPEQIRRVHRLFKFGESETERPVDDSSLDLYNIPIISREAVLGVIAISCSRSPLSQSNLTFLQMLAGQVALAMDIQNLSDAQNDIRVEAEKEKMRGTLLRSISHDLRTPLTSILGASSTILEEPELDEQTLKSLAKDIKMDAQWLIRMVENILIITRISSDNLKVHKTMEAAEEVVSEAVSIVRKRFPDYIIHVHIPDELLMVPMDATLISQVLINLLENAVKNSPDGSLILVDLKQQGEYAVFDISDNGSGIPEHLLDNLFEVHSPTKEQAVDVSRGMGIGLSICKTIIQAHGGQIEGHNRSLAGAKFSFRLPLQKGWQA